MARQATRVAPRDQPWPNGGATLMATRAHILQAMKDVCESATDTVWLTDTETVFERLATIYSLAGGDNATLASMWPEYFGE